jgi:hypothetical protein
MERKKVKRTPLGRERRKALRGSVCETYGSGGDKLLFLAEVLLCLVHILNEKLYNVEDPNLNGFILFYHNVNCGLLWCIQY